MPTKEQLSQLRASESYFGGYVNDDIPNVRGSHMAGTGNNPFEKPFTGERIGVIIVDPETKVLKIIPDPPTEESSEISEKKENTP